MYNTGEYMGVSTCIGMDTIFFLGDVPQRARLRRLEQLRGSSMFRVGDLGKSGHGVIVSCNSLIVIDLLALKCRNESAWQAKDRRPKTPFPENENSSTKKKRHHFHRFEKTLIYWPRLRVRRDSALRT